MLDRAARTRTGLNVAAAPTGEDPRIRVDLAHLRSLEGQAKSLMREVEQFKEVANENSSA